MSNNKNRRFKVGDIVQHFKREFSEDLMRLEYLYEIVAFAIHTETKEKMVIYKALYQDENGEYKTFARPYDMFIAKVDKQKYPIIKQKYVFEKYIRQ